MNMAYSQCKTLVTVALLAVAGCSGTAPEATQEEAQPARPLEEIRDETHRFQKDGLVEAKVMPDHVGGKDFMPGGNHAMYEKAGKQYEVFFTMRRNNEQAMFLAMDYRDQLADHKFVPHFGGFYGIDGETPTLVFQKNKYVVVVAGLELEDADHAGRIIAGYIQ